MRSKSGPKTDYGTIMHVHAKITLCHIFTQTTVGQLSFYRHVLAVGRQRLQLKIKILTLKQTTLHPST